MGTIEYDIFRLACTEYKKLRQMPAFWPVNYFTGRDIFLFCPLYKCVPRPFCPTICTNSTVSYINSIFTERVSIKVQDIQAPTLLLPRSIHPCFSSCAWFWGNAQLQTEKLFLRKNIHHWKSAQDSKLFHKLYRHIRILGIIIYRQTFMDSNLCNS